MCLPPSRSVAALFAEPTAAVPVAAIGGLVDGYDDDVVRARHDLVVTAGTAV